MKKILIFGGTTEGREIAEHLAQCKISCDVCVATAYGEQLIEKSQFIGIKAGRLGYKEIDELVSSGQYAAVIDATHPYAEEITKNIQMCVAKTGIPFFRFEREVEGLNEKEGICFFDTAEECAKALKNVPGKIFLSTGSKNIDVFCKVPGIRERLVVRVLPNAESMDICAREGLEGFQIIAMQGPFTKEMNKVQMSDYGISVLVTKESGRNGGEDEKIQAAKEIGIPCFVIKKPVLTETANDSHNSTAFEVNSYSRLYERMNQMLNLKIIDKASLSISVIGTGPGDKEQLTVYALGKIEGAKYLFGAPRLIEMAARLNPAAKKMPLYRAKDIVSEIEKIKADNTGTTEIAALFSGDSGFYSGADNLCRELETINDATVELVPGISSIQYLSSKLFLSWQDAKILSLHGRPVDEWLPVLRASLSENKKIFCLTSRARDLQSIGKLILENYEENQFIVFAGFNLSYSDEQILRLAAEDCLNIEKEELCSLMIIKSEVCQK